MGESGIAQTSTGAVNCAICHTALHTAGDSLTACPQCGTPYHAECWQENRGCAVYGCPQVPPTEKWEDMEIPFSHWGNTSKSCPVCHQEIQAAAIRCRHCGATFATANPEDARNYRHRQAIEECLPRVRSGVVWLFALSLLTCSAPVAGLIALSWRNSRRKELKVLPALYTALVYLAIWIGLGQTVFLTLTVIFFAFRGH